MHRTILAFIVLVFSGSAEALSRDAEEFIQISKALESVHCEKRKLRREIVLAEAERRDASELRKRFAALDREPRTAKLEKRLGELEPRVRHSPDPEDLAAISLQYREALYRCE